MIAIKVRGIPWETTKVEIQQFFSTPKRYAIIDDSVKIGLKKDGVKSGEAIVLFENESEAFNASKELQG